jgi:hypothetical protein
MSDLLITFYSFRDQAKHSASQGDVVTGTAQKIVNA